MRTLFLPGIVAGLSIAAASAAVPRGMASYPFCPTTWAATSLGVFPEGDVEIDTTDGSVNGGPPSGVLTGTTRVLVFDAIAIAETSTVRVSGGPALALLSLSDFTIAGTVLASGADSPGTFASVPVPGGPGGGGGGNDALGGTGDGPGGGTQCASPENAASGGGGGGFGGSGGDGGRADLANAPPGEGGASYGDLTLALQGGSGGGAGSGPAAAGRESGAGGGGGLYLGAFGALTVAPSGIVRADGGDGMTSSHGASAGGSGGGIVLHAATVVNDGAVNADGGAGGEGGSSGGGGGGGGGRIVVASMNAAATGGGVYSVAGGPAGTSSGLDGSAGGVGDVLIDSLALDICPAVQPFLCYKAKTTRGTPPFAPRSEVVEDAFQSVATDITKPAALCNPAAEGAIAFEEDHFESFRVAPEEKHQKQTGILLVTPFGELSVDTLKPDRLLLQAAKSTKSAPPSLASPRFDPFQCYKAKLTKGGPGLAKGQTVDANDQFSEEPRTLRVKKLSRLCVPANVENVVIQEPDRLLACFSVTPAKGEPKHVRRSGVFVAQTFGVDQLDTVKEEEYCAPATFGQP